MDESENESAVESEDESVVESAELPSIALPAELLSIALSASAGAAMTTPPLAASVIASIHEIAAVRFIMPVSSSFCLLSASLVSDNVNYVILPRSLCFHQCEG